MANYLAHEPSPYLQQHRDNPVNWYPWSDTALDAARQQDKPLLVSIGYSACHWCHVMAHESFENPDIAAFMNEHFINIKVDREERPDIDAIFMTALQAMTGQGGWPLNMFATPDGVPFFGGTYWPPSDRHGMPGFSRVLQAIANAWDNNRSELLENANRVTTFLEDTTQPRAASTALTPDIADRALATLMESFDGMHGGFGTAPKFPQAPTLTFLVRHLQRTGSDTARTMLTTTLDHMAAGGIHDHLGGGFARYAVDATWTVPHFEKMLYDNARLMTIYLDAWTATGDARHAQVAVRTGHWLLNEMRLPEGGFASALDADSEGVEGRYYTWTSDEIDHLLPPEQASVIGQRFGITPGGNFEGTNILTIAASIDDIASDTGQTAEQVQTTLDVALAVLRDRRRHRVRPGQDDKVVTAWNGLAISAFARVGGTLRIAGFVAAAQRTARFLLDNVRNDDGTLWRTWNDGTHRGNGVLEDYVFLAEALVHLHQADGDPGWLHEADSLLTLAIDRFGREDGADFFDTASGDGDLSMRPQSLQDNPTPSGNSVAADVMLTLGALTERQALTGRAETLLAGLADLMQQHPAAFGRYLAVAERTFAPAHTLVIGGDPSSQGHQRLTATALRHPRPALTMAHVPPDASADTTREFPVFAERKPVDGASAAWLCREGACMLPAVSVADLEARLAEMDSELARDHPDM